MVLEIAILQIKDGRTEEFVRVMNEGGGCAALLTVPGCNSAKAMIGVENPGNALVLAEWDSVDAHNEGRASPGFGRFKEIAGPFFGQGGSMEHFRIS